MSTSTDCPTGANPLLPVPRGAGFALADLIQARSEPALDAACRPDAGAAAGSPTAIVTSEVPDLDTVVAGHHADGPLVLDVDQPAVRAILGLLVELVDAEEPGGGWNGADTVDVVDGWLRRLGIDPDRGLLHAQAALFSSTTARLIRVPAMPGSADADGVDHEIDLDRVADLVRAAGVECVIDTPGRGIAVLLAGPPTTEPMWAYPWGAQAGPGRFHWDRPATATLQDLQVGPDDRSVPSTAVRSVGALTEQQIAALIVAQTRIAGRAEPLTGAELAAIGLHPAGKG